MTPDYLRQLRFRIEHATPGPGPFTAATMLPLLDELETLHVVREQWRTELAYEHARAERYDCELTVMRAFKQVAGEQITILKQQIDRLKASGECCTCCIENDCDCMEGVT